MKNVLKVGLRYKAIVIPDSVRIDHQAALNDTTGLLAANLADLGYGLTPELLYALNNTSADFQADVLRSVWEAMGADKNWTPLVKGWDTPTGESLLGHVRTWFANRSGSKGTKLPCGHLIPDGTFDLDRYNGCPFCGTPFQSGAIENFRQGSSQRVLKYLTVADLEIIFRDLLTSNTALDATQLDSLQLLLTEFPLPEVDITMKETVIAVVDYYRNSGQPSSVGYLFKSPTDILRYLWFRHTGFLQLVEPRTIVSRSALNSNHLYPPSDKSQKARTAVVAKLKLKYTRKEGLMVAGWLNGLDLSAGQMSEMMHAKKNMWIRFIRALRLAEHSKRAGYEKLKELLDVFYNGHYQVWQGQVSQSRINQEAELALELLKQRPGLFARSLFANMLWLGSKKTLKAFGEVADKVPARLLLSLNMYANSYFDKTASRTVTPLGGTSKNIPVNKLLGLYDNDQLEDMKQAITAVTLMEMKHRFEAAGNGKKSIYIDPALFRTPLAIGDRSNSVQDTASALPGTKFEVESDTIRLFMQWGNGLPAQHLDMDLSCMIAYESHTEICSYSSLVVTGCRHSGDIIQIPEQKGTAEYIEINVGDLKKAGAKYVSFTCNAYSNGSISPNLVVGWMNSQFPMKISKSSGVAYDPSCVQHQLRVVNKLTKGLLFGVLDVDKREILWIEMAFGGQVVRNLNMKTVHGLIRKLDSKISIGELLMVKAVAQKMQVRDTPDAEEMYDAKWALNTAAVTQLLID